MIPTILRKDVKLLWKPALAVSVPYLLGSALFAWRFDQMISEAIAISIYIAAFYLLVSVVQLDPIPGDRADWLTRPIPRWHLLGAKLLFALMTVVVPMMLVDIAISLAMGFGFGDILRAALGHSATVFLGLVLPVMALAAITRSLAQCLLVVALVVLAYAAPPATMNWVIRVDSMKWIGDAALLFLGFLAACVILTLQFQRRMTRVSSAVALAACLCVAINARVPWHRAWGLQARLGSTPADGFQIRFDRTARPFQIPGSVRAKPPANKIYLPVQLDGWRKDFFLLQNASIRLKLPGGGIVETTVDPRELPSYSNPAYLPLEFGGAPLPAADAVSAEVTMHFLIRKELPSSTIAVNGQPQWIPHVGKCVATPLKTSVDIQCTQAGDPGTVVHIYQDGFSRDRISVTQDPLAPFFLRCSPSIFTRGSTTLNTFAPASPFRAEPVPPPSLLELRPVHISGLIERKLSISNLRLQDWMLH